MRSMAGMVCWLPAVFAFRRATVLVLIIDSQSGPFLDTQI
jgi:hypothetical protein